MPNKKTAAEHKRAGTFRHGRHTGPSPPCEIPPMPPDLAPFARACWDKVTIHLYKLGVISLVDDVALRLLCESWQAYLEADDDLAEHGLTVEWKSGRRANPAWKIKMDAHDRIMRIAQQYGLTALSRTGLKLGEDVDPESDQDIDDLLGLN